jgi:hypothetical protein
MKKLGINPVTGRMQIGFVATLKEIQTKTPKTYTNAKGEEKPYRIVTIDFTDANGKLQKNVTASVHEKNFEKGLEVGSSYLCTGEVDVPNNRVWINMSPNVGGNVATLDMFGVFAEEAPAATSAAAASVEKALA